MIIQILFSVALAVSIQYITAIRWRGKDRMQKTIPSKLHLRRRIQHISTGLLFYFLSFVLPPSLCSILLFIAAILFFYIHTSKRPTIQQWYRSTFSSLLRPEEIHYTLPGAFYFLLGTTILSILPSLDISRTCLLCLSLADPAAAIGGILLSNHKQDDNYSKYSWYKNKTWMGSLCCFIITFIIVFLQSPTLDILEAFISALSCSIIEGVVCRIPFLDDNLIIPLGTAATLWSYRYYNHGILKLNQ
jgi:dolichol kinase